MSKKARLGLMALTVAALVLALTIPAFATQPEGFVIDFEVKSADWDASTSEGKFTSEGFIKDKGTFSTFTDPVTPGIGWHITQTLYGKDGSITVKWNATRWYNPDCYRYIAGNFSIESGTGAYENLQGGGDMELCRPGTADYMYGTLEGDAHIEQ
jgi:hypothetical protein